MLVLACGDSGPDNVDLRGNWSVVYDPPMPVDWPGICSHSIPHAVLSMNELGDFDLSINTYDDCSNSGGELTASETLHLGSYARQGNSLSFTLDGANDPLFTGVIEDEFVRLTLPPEVGVSSGEVELLVGPRQPF